MNGTEAPHDPSRRKQTPVVNGFAGSVPEKYDRYMGPVFFEPYADDIAGRLPVRPGLRVLEVACGTGIVTRKVRSRLPADAHLFATDLNQAMLERARSKDELLHGIEWRQADAMALPFEDSSFDAIVCQFGVMFFPDKTAAFREAHRVLAPGGLFLFNVWDTIETNQLSLAAAECVEPMLASEPPMFRTIVFAFNDRNQIATWLSAAGFVETDIATVERPTGPTTARDAAVALIEGTPMAAQLAARSVDVERLVDDATLTIRERFGDPVESTMSALVCVARKSDA